MTDSEAIMKLENTLGLKYSDEQLNILNYRGGMCILACAGSGKTSVLSSLIAKRILTGEISNTQKLLCTTYGRGGADEMKQRISKVLKQVGIKDDLYITTIHAFYLRVLKEFGYPSAVVKETTRKQYLREACSKYKIRLDEDSFQTLDTLISYQVNNLMTDDALVKSHVYTLEISAEEYSKIRKEYVTLKGKNNVIDFDDMQLYMFYLLKGNEEVAKYCKSKWTDIYMDEAQDMSKIQYQILKRIISTPDKLVVVGDDDQCLTVGSLVDTKDIADINKGENIKAYFGTDKIGEFMTDHISEKEYCGEIIEITTNSGKTLRGTRNHIGFGRIHKLNKNIHYVLLGYSKKNGYKIDRVTRTNLTDLQNRLLKKGIDKAWIIGTYHNREEAVIVTETLQEIQQTKEERLLERLEEYNCDLRYPHFIMDSGKGIVTSTLFGGNGHRYGIRDSEVEVSNGYISEKLNVITDNNVMAAVEKRLQADWDCEIHKVCRINNTIYNFIPFGNMREGMIVPTVNDKGEIETDRIKSIQRNFYKGKVYDLSVPGVYNYAANNILVHNCIYQWRGADPSIILNICADYDIRRFILSTNYRCAGNIVEKAAVGIKHNINRSDKGMIPYNTGGKINICDCGGSNLYEMSKYVYKYIKDMVLERGISEDKIAVLSRSNNHLCLLNNMLFKDGIYCDSTADMKITKLAIYRSIKGVLRLAENTNNPMPTRDNLYKVCPYMKAAHSKIVANLQESTGVKLRTVLGYICKNIFMFECNWDEEVNNMSIPISAGDKLKSDLGYTTKPETAQGYMLLYNLLSSKNTDEIALKLLWIYEKVNEYQYKENEDKKRIAEGVIDYIGSLIASQGLSKTLSYLKTSELFEDGKMVVPGDKVTLATIHGAKGKEWDNVIIFADDNIAFPSFYGLDIQIRRKIKTSDIYDSIDEDRRLHYVAMTRAKKELTVFTDRKNVGVFLLEAFGLFDHKSLNDSKILEMVLNGYMPEDLKQAASDLWAQYGMEIDLSDINNEISIHCIEGDDEFGEWISIDDIQTFPAEKTYTTE